MDNTEIENNENKKSWQQNVIELVENSINNIVGEDELNVNDLDILYKLVDIHKDVCNEKYWKVKESEIMRYSGYGNYGGYEGYGEYGINQYGNEYGRRGGGGRYRGHDYIDRMGEDYGRYQESRSRYGAGEESDKSFHYMVKGLEDFIKVLYEEADTPQQKQELVQALQSSMR